MAKKANMIRPSDLPTKVVRNHDGTTIRMKVVQSESPTLPYDILAAFRSNVRRIKTEQRARARADADTPQA